MPDRVIREGWLSSPNIRQLEAKEEIFFFRLLLVVDDWGRVSARPEVLRKLCFPLVSGIRSANIACWLDRCESLGLLRRYPAPALKNVTSDASEQGVYLEVARFRQRIRHVRSKLPSPPDKTDTQNTAPAKTENGKRTPSENTVSKERKPKHHDSELSSETGKNLRNPNEIESQESGEKSEPVNHSLACADRATRLPVIATLGYGGDHAETSLETSTGPSQRRTRVRRKLFRREKKKSRKPPPEWPSTLKEKWANWVAYLTSRKPRISSVTLEFQKRHLTDILNRRGETVAIDSLEWPMQNDRTIPIETPLKKRPAWMNKLKRGRKTKQSSIEWDWNGT